MPGQEFCPPDHFDEFRLVRKLGEGAMGQVFLCRDSMLQRPVAVKFLKVASTSATERDRCLIEARAIARLTHANVVTVYRVGEAQGVPYIASEYIEGRSLDQVELPLPFERVLSIAVSLARGLSVAHERGVLHRDIKPANIMLTKNSEVKLLDFGVAKLLEEASILGGGPASPLPDSSGAQGAADVASVARDAAAAEQQPPDPLGSTLTSTSPLRPHSSAADREGHAVEVRPFEIPAARSHGNGSTSDEIHSSSSRRVGTPLYMSPEAWKGGPISPRADIYSLGAVLYELCVGVPPHDATSIDALRFAAMTTAPAPLRSVAPHIPAWFAALVDRCLKRDPDARFASGTELLAALESQARSPGAASPLSQEAPRLSARLARAGAALAAGGLVLTGGLLFYSGRPVSGMATIQGGTFLMGAARDEIAAAQIWCKELLGSECDEVVQQAFKREEPQRQVTLSPFRLDRREVTTEEFVGWLNSLEGVVIEGDRYVKQKGELLADIYPTYQPFAGYTYDKSRHRFSVPAEFRRRPATQLSWSAAARYCEAQHKRLPTEAEWEMAARGSEGRRFPWGFSEPTCERSVLARLPGMPCAKEGSGPKDVASTHADRTPEGVYDLGGNVSEWVLDGFLAQYPPCPAPCTDPVVVPDPAQQPVLRVVRGSNWEWAVVTARGTTRSRYESSKTPKNFGFRCAESQQDPARSADKKQVPF